MLFIRVALFSLILMIVPALLSMVFTLASPPPGLQTEDSAFAVQLQKNDLWWIFMQIIHFLVFPIAAIGRCVVSWALLKLLMNVDTQ